MTQSDSPTFFEFFAGGGLVRHALQEWKCTFANDFSPLKASVYRLNFGEGSIVEGDVWDVSADQMPGIPDMVWASSPCQDLSLAGRRLGLSGERSSAFWGFWRRLEELLERNSQPVVVIENVVGLLSSHDGTDFQSIGRALADKGYCFGALEIDAADFVPQSRRRVFIVASRHVPEGLTIDDPVSRYHTTAVRTAWAGLPDDLRKKWIWWSLTPPQPQSRRLHDLLESDSATIWHSQCQTDELLELIGAEHRKRLRALQASGSVHYLTGFRRMRKVASLNVQRLELRFDGVAGCLRTPGGGSSGQFVFKVKRDNIRSRRLTSLEAARLMGLRTTYRLPEKAGAAMAVLGDGVAIDVVRHLANHLLRPLVSARDTNGSPSWVGDQADTAAA